MAAAAAAAEGAARLPGLGLAGALFILGFRLWDDLADRAWDRRRHPHRVLARVRDPRRFRVLCALLLAAPAAPLALLAGWRGVAGHALLVVAFLVLYRVTGAGTRIRAALVLAKYPAFVLLAAAPAGPMALPAVLAAYSLPLLDEMRAMGPGILVPAMPVLALAAGGAWLLGAGGVA